MKTFKTFAEEMETSLVRTILELEGLSLTEAQPESDKWRNATHDDIGKMKEINGKVHKAVYRPVKTGSGPDDYETKPRWMQATGKEARRHYGMTGVSEQSINEQDGTPQSHPYHKTLLAHGYKYSKTHTKDGITHEYDNPKTGHYAQTWGNDPLEIKRNGEKGQGWWHGHRDQKTATGYSKTLGTGHSKKSLSDHLQKIHG